jgi:3-hydroxyacyl-CoA dehydrogenase
MGAPGVNYKGTVGVVGSGVMGSAISLSFAFAGYRVLLFDVVVTEANKGVQRALNLAQKMVDKGRIGHSSYEFASVNCCG